MPLVPPFGPSFARNARAAWWAGCAVLAAAGLGFAAQHQGRKDGAEKPNDAVEIRELFVLKGPKGAIRAAAVSADGKRALSVGADKSISVWDLEKGRRERSFTPGSVEARGLALLPDGKRAVLAGADKLLYVWDLDDNKELRRFAGHTDALIDVDVSADGRWALTSGEDRYLRPWDLEKGTQLRPKGGWPRLIGQAEGVRLAADGKRAVSWHRDGGGVLWEVPTGTGVVVFRSKGDFEVRSMAVAADGKSFLVGEANGTLHLWDAEAKKLIRDLEGLRGPLHVAALSPDGRWAAAATSEGADAQTLAVWDARTGKEVQRFDGPLVAPNGLRFSADGRLLLAAGSDGLLRVYEFRPAAKRP
jgi:WD40 repeat protein